MKLLGERLKRLIHKILFIILIIFDVTALYAKINDQDAWVDLYLRDCSTVKINQACKQNLEKALGNMLAYRRLTLKYLDKKGLPHFLATIPIIESSYNVKAISIKGAIGLWQLMPFHIEIFKTNHKKIIGRNIEIIPTKESIMRYGLNPVLNTRIAVNYLELLYKTFRDDPNCDKLVIMSYNAGSSRVKDWIDGKSELPEETINFYNKFLAIQYVIKNMNELGIRPTSYNSKILILDYIMSAL